MLLQITVSACTTPLNFDIPALTVTMLAETSTMLALTVTFAEAFTVIPLLCSFTEFPLLSTTSTEPGPSCSVIFCPPGVSTMQFSCPVLSSSVIFTPFLDRRTFRLFCPDPSIVCGGLSDPFHNPPNTYGRRG